MGRSPRLKRFPALVTYQRIEYYTSVHMPTSTIKPVARVVVGGDLYCRTQHGHNPHEKSWEPRSHRNLSPLRPLQSHPVVIGDGGKIQTTDIATTIRQPKITNSSGAGNLPAERERVECARPKTRRGHYLPVPILYNESKSDEEHLGMDHQGDIFARSSFESSQMSGENRRNSTMSGSNSAIQHGRALLGSLLAGFLSYVEASEDHTLLSSYKKNTLLSSLQKDGIEDETFYTLSFLAIGSQPRDSSDNDSVTTIGSSCQSDSSASACETTTISASPEQCVPESVASIRRTIRRVGTFDKGCGAGAEVRECHGKRRMPS